MARNWKLDVATRTDDKIMLFEMKAKSLTASARSGDMFAFIDDYTKSYLALLKQLTRHEYNLRQGITPLTQRGESVADLQPIKVAVSPLSYGPVSDHTLASALLRSMANARLHPVNPNPSSMKIIEHFNEAVATVTSQIAVLAPTRDGKAELFPYLIDVFWLDLGQLLYALDRASTTWDALAPIKNITFSTSGSLQPI